MKISVIIPVYNLAKYISKSLNSILSQKFDHDLEVIVVDDGSTDNSLEIVDKIREADSRVKLLSQKNAGVSAARNAGLDIATGKYVVFVDGDDILFPNVLQMLTSELDKNPEAILACGLHHRITSYEQKAPNTEDTTRYSDSEEILKNLLVGKYDVSACAKMFVKASIGNLRFVQGKRINEDKYFLFKYLLHNKGIVIDKNVYVYGYYIRNGSATTSLFSSATLDMIYFSQAIENDIRVFAPSMFDCARYNNIVTHLAVLKKIIRSGKYNAPEASFEQLRSKTLALQNDSRTNTKNNRNLELSILRSGSLLYVACVKLFDVLRKHKTNERA